jgi:ABC-type lipoprotein export system ATPase subunit
MRGGKPHWFLKERKTIVDDVSLQLNAGEIIAITGKSGCGKTTLLNVIAGLTKPSKGSVYFKERRMIYFMDVMPALVRNLEIGFIFQTFQLINSETVKTNVLMPALIAGNYNRETFMRMESLLERLGMKDFANTTVACFPADRNSASPSPARSSTTPLSFSATNDRQPR